MYYVATLSQPRMQIRHTVRTAIRSMRLTHVGDEEDIPALVERVRVGIFMKPKRGEHIEPPSQVDIPSALHNALQQDAREPDHLLHASSHLVAPLRHVQLELAGAPQKPRPIAEEITLMTGTLWHSYMNEMMWKLRVPIMMEVKLDDYMPDGWSGTADWIIWNPETRAFRLQDLKTIKGQGLSWILHDGAKDAHQWQLTTYWLALRNMGLPLDTEYSILYLPKEAVPGKDVQPTVVDCRPLDEALVTAVMRQRKQDVDAYLAGKAELAPIPERELKRVWNAKAKTFDLILKPHWSSMYCRFDGCGCGEQGQTKQGSWILIDGMPFWNPREGCDVYDDSTIFANLTPHPKDFK